jgi:hypothetical protein
LRGTCPSTAAFHIVAIEYASDATLSCRTATANSDRQRTSSQIPVSDTQITASTTTASQPTTTTTDDEKIGKP